ncbi:hypothetical protein [Couchioplanes caeruleus]|uniref:hypothetical protein n=1 Tax=Couchioplanes caeruleus TaxID=56438 RepID=UPI0011608291|nr:hypothetical protein [Couchioplanes caeruleus]
MAYDVLGESRQLIDNGLPERPVRLSTRRRFAPAAVDVDDDIACTRFIRRGAGCFWDETHLLARGDNGWQLLATSGASTGEPWSANAFEQARTQFPAGTVEVQGGGAALRNPNRLLPWGARWVRAAELLVDPGVGFIAVDDRQLRRMAAWLLCGPRGVLHGHPPVTWPDVNLRTLPFGMVTKDGRHAGRNVEIGLCLLIDPGRGQALAVNHREVHPPVHEADASHTPRL